MYIFVYASVYCIQKWRGEARVLQEGRGSTKVDGEAQILGYTWRQKRSLARGFALAKLQHAT